MLQREKILEELEKRMSVISAIKFVARNPSKSPSHKDLPCVTIMEMEDIVYSLISSRGGHPTYKRTLRVIVEVFISGSTDTLATKELMEIVEFVKIAIYAAPYGLGKLAHLVKEDQHSRVHRPGVGEHIAGMGIAFEIFYVETN